jgi:type II secretory pathway predicted ATPase ExeA
MYETFFGLDKRPFVSTPTLDRYFAADATEHAFKTTNRVIERGEGPVAIFGGHGLGKSMVALRLADAWRKSFEIILLNSSKLCTRRALLQSLLFELRMPYRDMSEGELRLSLMDRIQYSIENPSEGIVLIVDEAQTLDTKLLEELRLITNLARDGRPRVRLILLGTVRLEEILGHPKAEALNQRLAARCYLNPLSLDQTRAYVKHKIEICGTNVEAVMTGDAVTAVHRASGGIPRVIDQISDLSLVFAEQQNQNPVSAKIVESAWAELQQMPAPWNDIEKTAAGLPNNQDSSSRNLTIEFGTLSDDDSDEEVGFDDQPGIEHIASDQIATDDLVRLPDVVLFSKLDDAVETEEFSTLEDIDESLDSAATTPATPRSSAELDAEAPTCDTEPYKPVIQSNVQQSQTDPSKKATEAPEPLEYQLKPETLSLPPTDDYKLNDELRLLEPVNQAASSLQVHGTLDDADDDADIETVDFEPVVSKPTLPAETNLKEEKVIQNKASDSEPSRNDQPSEELVQLPPSLKSLSASSANLSPANLSSDEIEDPFGNDFDEEFDVSFESSKTKLRSLSSRQSPGYPTLPSSEIDDDFTDDDDFVIHSGYTHPATKFESPFELATDSSTFGSEATSPDTTNAPKTANENSQTTSSNFAAKISQIEQSLESEIRDLISSMNLGAMAMDPKTSIQEQDFPSANQSAHPSPFPEDLPGDLVDHLSDSIDGMDLVDMEESDSTEPLDNLPSSTQRKSSSDRSETPSSASDIENKQPSSTNQVADGNSQILSFASLDDARTHDDDRELLIIEDDLPVVRRGLGNTSHPPTVSQPPNNYTQLFSKLRG